MVLDVGRLLGLLACLLASPAAALCVMMPPEDFAALDWGKAERFDQGEALLLIQGMVDAPDLMSLPKATKGTVTLWAQVEGSVVLILRQVETPNGSMLCSDDPIDRATFETGKLRTLPRSG